MAEDMIEKMAEAAWAARERWSLEGFALGQCDKLGPWAEQADVVKEDCRREMRAVLSALSLDFTTALGIAKERFKQNPNWRRLEGTPWENDAPVIAAELMCKRLAQGERSSQEQVREKD